MSYSSTSCVRFTFGSHCLYIQGKWDHGASNFLPVIFWFGREGEGEGGRGRGHRNQ